jgi:hypothetical protein
VDWEHPFAAPSDKRPYKWVVHAETVYLWATDGLDGTPYHLEYEIAHGLPHWSDPGETGRAGWAICDGVKVTVMAYFDPPDPGLLAEIVEQIRRLEDDPDIVLGDGDRLIE